MMPYTLCIQLQLYIVHAMHAMFIHCVLYTLHAVYTCDYTYMRALYIVVRVYIECVIHLVYKASCALYILYTSRALYILPI